MLSFKIIKKLSIKTKLIIAISLLVLLSASAIAISGYLTLKNDVIEKAKKRLTTNSFETMDKIDRAVHNQRAVVKLWGRMITLTSALNYEIYDEANDFLNSVVRENKDLLNLFLLDKECVIKASNVVSVISKKYERLPCNSLSNLEAHFVEPARDAIAEESIYSIIAPVKAERNTGFLAADFKWAELIKIIRGREGNTDNIQNSASYLLINKEGILIAASDPELKEDIFKLNLLQKGLESAKISLKEPNGAIVEKNLKDKQTISGYYGSEGYLEWKGAGWRLISTEDMAAALSVLNEIGWKIAIITIFMVLCGLLLSWLLVSAYISRPVKSVISEFKKIADGDLRGGFEADTDDEFGTLAKAMHTMTENLRSLIGSFFKSSEQIFTATNEMVSISHQMNKGSEGLFSSSENTLAAMTQSAASIRTVGVNTNGLAQMVDEATSSVSELGSSIKNVADNTQNQSAAVEQTVSAIDEMRKSIEEVVQISYRQAQDMEKATMAVDSIVKSIEAVVKNIEEASLIAEKNTRDGEAGNSAVKLTAEAMNKITEVMRSTTGAISKLGNRSAEIGKILKVIDEITEQTNLLALNAAIIAAQAGEHGKGFAVVADEIRELANRSMLATKEIGAVIEGIRKETTEAVGLAMNTLKETEESNRLSNIAGNAISNIMDGINKAAFLLSKISTASQQQKGLSIEIVNTMGNLNNITAKIKSAASEQAAASSQIRSAAENMMNITVQVTRSTKEQAATSSEVVRTMADMNSATQQVANATVEQQKGVEMVVSAMKNVREISSQNLNAVGQLSKSADSLAQQGKNMMELINRFKI